MSFNKSLLLLCLLLSAIAPPASALAREELKTPVKAYFVKIKDPKEMKSFLKKHNVMKAGDQYLIVGEVAIDGDLKLNAPVQLYQVALPRKAKMSKPLALVPYEFDKSGKRKHIKKFKKYRISVPSKYLEVVEMGNGRGFRTATISDFGLYSVCSDLERRRQEVLGLAKALKKLKQSESPVEWKRTRDQLLLSWEGLVSYVENFPLFASLGGSLRAEFDKSQKKIRDIEKSDRMDAFRASVKDAEVEEVDLEAPNGMKFHQIESRHIRIVYLIGEGGITDAYAKELALLAEQAIEFFRSVAIDPYPELVEEQDGDLPSIPDSIFQEYFIGPDSTEYQKELFPAQYNRNLSDERVFEVMSTGTTLQGTREEPLFLSFSKNRPGSMKGLVVHQLGHSLSSLHYNHSNKRNVRPALPLVQESVARYLCFEKLGNNNLRCTNFQVAKYAKQDVGDGKTKVQLGDSFQKRFFKLALRAPTMEACAIVPLNKLNELHMAKGWMTYYYILNFDGLLGQQWLRGCHDAVTKKGDGDRTGLDRNAWRDSTKELYPDEDLAGDPLHLYEERLKKVAEEALDG
ncbi:MAG: hypothetical protein GY930_07775 [bacterium]|nr:hypothetical protein [bacterium]